MGGWLLLEPGPAHRLWKQAQVVTGEPMNSHECEHSLCSVLEHSGRKADVIDAHRKGWLRDLDFKNLKEHGLNAVRVPFGYWLVTGPTQGDPFVGPALHYLDQVVDMAESHGFQVLLDLHANPGGEQGGPPAGRKNDKWRSSHWRFDESLEVLKILAERYAGRKCVTGLQVANEPSNVCSMSSMCDWFEKAIQIIRSAGMGPDQTAVVVPVYEYFRLEEFVCLWGARGNFLRFENVTIDIHYYHVFSTPMESLDHDQHIAMVARHGRILRSLPGAVVGEWSLGRPDRLKATGEMNRQFGDAQLHAYEAASHGWFFWNYCDVQDQWNVTTCIEKGWLPRNLGSMQEEVADDNITGCVLASSSSLSRLPPPGRFPQCYGSEERRLLADPSALTSVGRGALQHGLKRPRSESDNSAQG